MHNGKYGRKIENFTKKPKNTVPLLQEIFNLVEKIGQICHQQPISVTNQEFLT